MKERREMALRWTLFFGLSAQMALCPRLWTADRAFPCIPAVAGMHGLPNAATLTLAALLLLLSLLAALSRVPGWSVAAVGGSLALFDINRLQPWFYLLLLLYALLGKDWRAGAFVVASTYLWSGLQKINASFAENMFPWLLQPLGLSALKPFWFVAPAVEVGIGVMLLVPRTRGVGIGLAVALHAFLLLALGPFGRNANTVVWPWNLWMPFLAFLFFFRNEEPVLPALWSSPRGQAVSLLTGFMPLLSFFGLWDGYLSAALYSGRASGAFLFFSEEGARRVPPQVRPFLERRPDRIGLDVYRWGNQVLNVPPYPETRVYRSVARWLMDSGVPESDVRLFISERPSLNQTKAISSMVPVSP